MKGYKIIFAIDENVATKRLLATLEIPDDAQTNTKRNNIINAQYAKYRCNKALVVSIVCVETNVEESRGVSGFWDKTLEYRVGEMVQTDFDVDVNNVCGKGIHFFLNKQRALTYRTCYPIWTLRNSKKCIVLERKCQDGTHFIYGSDGHVNTEVTVVDGHIVKHLDFWFDRTHDKSFAYETLLEHDIIVSRQPVYWSNKQ